MRTTNRGGAVTQLGPSAVNRQCSITCIRCIHSLLYPACINTRCRYAS